MKGKIAPEKIKTWKAYDVPKKFNTGSKSKRMELVNTRYFTFTGDHLEGTPHRITYNKEALELLPHIGALLKDKVIYPLWSSDYPEGQRSEKLYALIRELARYTKGDLELLCKVTVTVTLTQIF